MPGPRKGTVRSPAARSYVGVKLGPAALEQIDALAAETGRQRSETIRLLLGHALVSPVVLRAIRKEAG